ncbi:F0F1 ATP synthase subunit gamma [Longibacter salinarum]|uniref:F0F1 ATP synthase subunit gamma n=1 Tax=Longibacter salinarum TaxID=1850348 RepID=A0A2A8D1N3_9BACT|nr:F0F1 ATP synthase subunit gamma [Longibacter salinarum]PEN14872.1 F0F1 ATP synthase subunit gamma [Longibacter salinarum]
METLESLRRQINSTRRLRSVVRTMKVLSLTSIRQCERAVEALEAYDETVQLGLRAAVRRRHRLPVLRESSSSRPQPVAIIVIGSTWGMCGRFNEQLAERVAREMDDLHQQQVTLLALGDYVSGPLERHGVVPDAHGATPESVEGITRRVEELLLRVEAWRREDGIDRLLLFYNDPASGSMYDANVRQLLPIDVAWLRGLREQAWPTKMLPNFRTEWESLFSALVREYLFVSLHRSFAESLASEHSSRLAAMQRAETNVDERLQSLNARFHRQRQTAVTAEVLDIMGGFEALQTPGDR